MELYILYILGENFCENLTLGVYSSLENVIAIMRLKTGSCGIFKVRKIKLDNYDPIVDIGDENGEGIDKYYHVNSTKEIFVKDSFDELDKMIKKFNVDLNKENN